MNSPFSKLGNSGQQDEKKNTWVGRLPRSRFLALVGIGITKFLTWCHALSFRNMHMGAICNYPKYWPQSHVPHDSPWFGWRPSCWWCCRPILWHDPHWSACIPNASRPGDGPAEKPLEQMLRQVDAGGYSLPCNSRLICCSPLLFPM